MGSLDRVLAAVLGRLTGDVQERRNVFWVSLAAVCYGATLALFGGELWSGFLVKTGYDTKQIGFLASMGTTGSAVGLLAFMGLADRVRNRIRTYSWCVVGWSMAPIAAGVLALTPREVVPPPLLFALLSALCLGQMIIGALWIMLDYPILMRTISVGIRGRVFAILTTAFGVLAVLGGLLSAKVLKEMPYPTGYALCFVVAGAFGVLRAVIYSRQRELPLLSVPGASRSALPFQALLEVLKLREFQMLAGPHVLRGLTSGMAGFGVAVAMKHLALPEEYPGYATAANYAAGILGGIALGLIADRWGAGPSTLFGDVLLALGMGTMLLFGSPPAFIVLYFVLHFGRNIEDSAIPFGTTVIVPAERMGAFSSARLMVLYASSAVGAILSGFLFANYSPVLVFALGAVLKAANGVWFWWVFRMKPAKGSSPQPADAVTRDGVAV